MNEDFDKFEQEVQIHLYSRLAKLVALLGFLVGMGLVFIANSSPNKPIIADTEVKVKGLVCSICGYGLVKLFKKDIVVVDAVIDIQKNLLLLDFLESEGGIVHYIKNDRIIKMVKDSGYEVESIKRLHNKKPNRYNKP
jgi:hypothetical protein